MSGLLATLVLIGVTLGLTILGAGLMALGINGLYWRQYRRR